jgi:di/tricarboxylate transporter
VQASTIDVTVSLRQFAVVTLMGSSTAYATPLGYVTSIMVQQAANITWGEFFKYGMPCQMVVGFLAVFCTRKFVP